MSTLPTTLPQRRPMRRFTLRGLAITLGILATLILIAAISVSLWLRSAMHASLPQLDGQIQAPGLAAPVTITRDTLGVPSITAASLDDMLFAQGYTTAQDRLWQMDMLRRHAAGTLAELLGSALIPHDRTQRTLRLAAAADLALPTLPADQLHQLTVYAAGVNAFIAQHPNDLPVEFHALHYHPAPWTPRDSLLVSLAMFQDLSTEFPTKLRREALASHLPANLLADLYPTTSWRDHPPTQPTIDLTTPTDEIEQIPLDPSQSRTATPYDILALANQFPDQLCPDCRSGSNNWAVAANRSASGAPLVSNDMHLALNTPDIWYEAALHGPNIDVAGFTLPGLPFVLVGRNRHVAWGLTAQLADTQDLRIEHLRGSGNSTEFQHPDGSWSPVIHHPETIIVRGSQDVPLDVLTTTETLLPATLGIRPAATTIETPIISSLLPSETRAISLAWTIYDPANLVLPHLEVNTAADGPSLVAALATFGGPSLNLIWADDHSHIGYHAIGAIPIRGPAIHHPRITQTPIPTTEPSVDADTPATPAPNTVAPVKTTIDYTIGSPISPIPVDALNTSQTWSGYIPYSDLPNITDPPNGILATANSRITPDDYPYFIANDWAPPYRSERIYKRLSNRANLTPADMLTLQNDVHSDFDLLLAQRLVYALDHTSAAALQHDPALASDAKRLHQAADILRTWHGDVSANSTAATIVAATRIKLIGLLLVPQIAAHDHFGSQPSPQPLTGIPPRPDELASLYVWSAQSVAIESLLQHTPKRWLSADFATWDDLLATAVEHALKESNAPSDLATWHYGNTHRIAIDHPLFAMIPGADVLLGTPSGSGAQPTGGDATTIRANGSHFGPSERFTADLANPNATQANITTGQSGNPSSPNYLDQFHPWLTGTTFTLPLTTPTITHTLTLIP